MSGSCTQGAFHYWQGRNYSARHYQQSCHWAERWWDNENTPGIYFQRWLRHKRFEAFIIFLRFGSVLLFDRLIVGFLTLSSAYWSHRHYSMCKRTQMKFAQLGGSLERSPWSQIPSSARNILQQYKGDIVSILIVVWRGLKEFFTHVVFI